MLYSNRLVLLWMLMATLYYNLCEILMTFQHFPVQHFTATKWFLCDNKMWLKFCFILCGMLVCYIVNCCRSKNLVAEQ